MPRTNRDVEELHSDVKALFDDSDDEVTELFDQCYGDSGSGKSICFGDKGSKWKERLWVPKRLITSGEVKVNKLRNGFEIVMPRWFAERNDLV
jgi:hypothetical protein